MARVYPSAGSAYTYVGSEIHPLAGYVVGWSMLMDYMLKSNHLRHLVQRRRAERASANSLCRMSRGFRRFIYRSQSARSADLEPCQCIARSFHEHRGGDLSRLRDPLHSAGGSACGRAVAAAVL